MGVGLGADVAGGGCGVGANAVADIVVDSAGRGVEGGSETGAGSPVLPGKQATTKSAARRGRRTPAVLRDQRLRRS